MNRTIKNIQEQCGETDDAVLFYGETYAWTPFHQSSCGMTRSAEEVLGTEEYPYLRAKECPLDKEADDEIQVFTYHYAEIQELCRDFLVAEDEKEQLRRGYAFDDFEIQSRDSAGYVKSLRIGNTRMYRRSVQRCLFPFRPVHFRSVKAERR